MARYAELLTTEGVKRGLIGPREGPRIWERHLLNCAVLGVVVPADARVADIGSGAGLPGLVLAIDRPDLRVTLVEPLLRRTTFLSEVVAELGLLNVEVLRARAEEVHGRREFDVVTSRAVAPLDRLLGWSMPLVRAGGVLLAMKGTGVEAEIGEAAATLRRFNCGAPEVLTLGAEVLAEPTMVVRVVAGGPSRLGLAEQDGARRSGASGRPSSRGGRRAPKGR